MTNDRLRRGLERAATQDLTYADVGATVGPLPPGYHHATRSGVIGHGSARFTEAASAVLHWQVQLRAGVTVEASTPDVQVGSNVVQAVGPVLTPCRVVYVVDEPRRAGFAYGTLPGHAVRGEESFIVEWRDDDSVTFTVTAFSTPAWLAAKVAGPVGRLVQSLAARRYIRGMGR